MGVSIPLGYALLGASAAGTVASTVVSADQTRKQAHGQADAIKAQTLALANNKTPVMPTADGAAVQAATQASIAEQVARRGRASTILTGTSDKLGN